MRTVKKLMMALCWTLISTTSIAQKDSESFWGPDTTLSPPTDLEDYNAVLEHVYGNLEKHMNCDVLVDRVPEISRREVFQGKHPDSILTMDDFYLIYTEMTDGQIPYERRPSFYYLDSLARIDYSKTNLINIGLLRYKYQRISEEAKTQGAIYWDEYELKVTDQEITYDLFESREVFALSPLIEGYLHEGKVSFILDSNFFFTNQLEDMPFAMAVDFGDGNGFKEVRFNEPIDVYYGEADEYRWLYTVHFESDEVLEGSTTFSAREDDPIFEYECGEGGLLAEGDVVRDLPQEIVNLSVPAAIANPKNDDPNLVTGSLGIYFGCGNTDCELRKPYIVVSGFGPDVPVAVTQKTLTANLASNMLYTNMNGIYGSDASSSQEAGANNGANILYRLRNEGYDVVTVYFENGVDYVQNHAAMIEAAITWVNQEKASNGSKHENVICGQSMGGISSRYALAAWEKKYMQEGSDPYKHHQCRLWISWEGEMQGATIPIGLQLSTWYMTRKLPVSMSIASYGIIGLIPGLVSSKVLKIFALNNALNNVAAKSILTYHFSNNKDKSTVLHRHPLYLKLQNELDSLGYPEYPRRVAIADGSSNVTRPDGLKESNGEFVNTCLLDLVWYNPLVVGTTFYIKVRTNTGELNSDALVFKGKFKKAWIPIPGLNNTVTKNYPKAEYAAPGSYERFYQGLLRPLNEYSISLNRFHCNNKKFRAPFVPTTSVFDIQDDTSLDYSYDMVANSLFYAQPNISNSRYGYPHSMGVSHKTPFHSLYATTSNRFHIQNPEQLLSDFIFEETNPSPEYLQNRSFKGRNGNIYFAQFDGRDLIEIGASVSYRTEIGSVKIDSFSNVEINSSRIEIKNGFSVGGGKLRLSSAEVDLDNCFEFEGPAVRDKKGVKDSDFTTVEDDFSDSMIRAFPNPTNGVLNLEVNEEAVGSSLKIYNINGQLLDVYKVGETTLKVDCSSFSAGLIMILLVDEDQAYTQKIIIQ
ncbi:MAG: T9SS type A sorting domain-containing protein [Cryomorphaceae bacterium]